MRTRPALCCFGHIHEGWGAERLAWADDAEDVPGKACSIGEWKEGGWKAGFKDGQEDASVKVDLDAAKEKHAAFVDISEAGGNAVQPGKETLFVNAAIMDVKYRPINAPWVVDMDLPRKESSSL